MELRHRAPSQRLDAAVVAVWMKHNQPPQGQPSLPGPGPGPGSATRHQDMAEEEGEEEEVDDEVVLDDP